MDALHAFSLSPQPFIGITRKVPLTNTFDWIRQGWETFLSAPKLWLSLGGLLYLFWVIIEWVGFYHLRTSLQPGHLRTALGYITFLAPCAFAPLIAVGGLQACRKIADEKKPQTNDLFWGLQQALASLSLLGLLCLLGWMALLTCAIQCKGPLAIFLPTLAGFAFFMAIWFAPVLIAFHGMSPFAALRASFLACSRNANALFVYGFIMLVLHFLALLPLGLGLPLLLPVVLGSMHASYRDIFSES